MYNSILFRFEASHYHGTGHLIRSLNLCDYLPNEIVKYFIIKDSLQKEEIKKIISFKNHQINVDFISGEYSLEQEALYLKNNYKHSLIITDLCHKDIVNRPSVLNDYHAIIKKFFEQSTIVTIGDCRITEYGADVAVIPYCCGNSTKFSKNILYGLNYFVFPKSYSYYTTQKTIKPIGTNILICLGGSDLYDLNEKIALSVVDIENINVRLIIGPLIKGNKRTKIINLVSNYRNLELIEFSLNLPEILQWSDIAIVGEGLIKFDAAVFGVPSLLITQFDHDSDPIRSFISLETCEYIGRGDEVKNTKIYESVTRLLKNSEKRSILSFNGRKNLNLKGGEKFFEKILKPYL